MDFEIQNDIEAIIDLLEITTEDLAKEIGLTRVSLNNWLSGSTRMSPNNLSKIYEFAYAKGLRLNKIKEQLYREEINDNNNEVLLFHGAKTFIEGDLSIEKSRSNLDLGKGFYCGENLEQSAMFVSSYPSSSLYFLSFSKKGLKEKVYNVNQEWMLLIAYFRNRLGSLAESQKIQKLVNELEGIDYIIAPIADNRMFEIIDNFIDGEITDVQCQHCLSATNLGRQYVFKTEKALGNIKLIERGFLSEAEKQEYLNNRSESNSINNDKVKMARRQYRNQGKYIEEILK